MYRLTETTDKITDLQRFDRKSQLMHSVYGHVFINALESDYTVDRTLSVFIQSGYLWYQRTQDMTIHWV